jgi:hypothetical protein
LGFIHPTRPERVTSLRRRVGSQQTDMSFSTWPETLGSGAGIGMAATGQNCRRIHGEPRLARRGCSAAVLGDSPRVPAVSLPAMVLNRAGLATPSASALLARWSPNCPRSFLSACVVAVWWAWRLQTAATAGLGTPSPSLASHRTLAELGLSVPGRGLTDPCRRKKDPGCARRIRHPRPPLDRHLTMPSSNAP